MASAIFQTEPPKWLQDITRPSEPGMAGKVLGELVGGMAIAAQEAKGDMEKAQAQGEDATWLGSWIKAVPRGIHENRLNVSDPMWRLKAQSAELNMAQTALGMQEQMQRIDLNKTKIKMLAEDQQAVPAWLQEHPTVESRTDASWPVAKTPEWNRNLDQLRLRDSQSSQEKIKVQGTKAFTDRVAKLPEDLAAGFVQYFGKVPPPVAFDALSLAEQTAGQRKANEATKAEQEAIARGETPQTKITDKGVEKIYKPASETAAFMPEEVTLPGGTKLIRVGPRQFRLAPKTGETMELTATQLRDIANDLKIRSKATSEQKAAADKILDYLEKKAVFQIDKAVGTNAPAANPYKVDGVYRSGDKKLKYTGGDFNDPKNWQEIP